MGNMSEHEKTLREWLRATPGGPLSHELATQALDAALSAARDAALEEAAVVLDAEESDLREPGGDEQAAETVGGLAARIRSLKSRPAERYLPESKVREVVVEMANTDWRNLPHAAGRKEGEALVYFLARELGKRLGVDLDAKGEDACPKCHHPTGQHDPNGACGAEHCTCNGWRP